MTASHSSSVMFTSIRSRRIPALLTRMSRRPNSSIACWIMRPAPAKSATFSPFATASPPAALISSTTCSAGAASASLAGEPAAEVVDDDLRAGGRERERVRAADAAPGAGDDRDFSAQIWHGGSLLLEAAGENPPAGFGRATGWSARSRRSSRRRRKRRTRSTRSPFRRERGSRRPWRPDAPRGGRGLGSKISSLLIPCET